MNRLGTTQPEIVEYNQCQEAVKKLNDFLSHELRPEEEEEVQRHLSQCKGCFSKFHFEETLLRTIRERALQVRTPGHLKSKILGLLGQVEQVEVVRGGDSGHGPDLV